MQIFPRNVVSSHGIVKAALALACSAVVIVEIASCADIKETKKTQVATREKHF